MSRIAPLLTVLALTGCTTQAANCAKAEHLRTAAIFTLQALDRVCPIPR